MFAIRICERRARVYICRMRTRSTSILRFPLYLVIAWALLLIVPGPTHAQTVAAVFDFELIDTSL